MRPATRQQIRAIQIARKAVTGMNDVIYRDLILEVSQGATTSSTGLSIEQASKLLGILQQHGFQIKPGNKPDQVADVDNVVNIITPKQRSLINYLISEIHWRTQDGYKRWLKTNMGLDGVATKAQASRVIEGLKGLKEHSHVRHQ